MQAAFPTLWSSLVVDPLPSAVHSDLSLDYTSFQGYSSYSINSSLAPVVSTKVAR